MVDVKLWKLGCQNREGYVMKYNAVASQTISHGETLEIGGTESGQFEPPVLPCTMRLQFRRYLMAKPWKLEVRLCNSCAVPDLVRVDARHTAMLESAIINL